MKFCKSDDRKPDVLIVDDDHSVIRTLYTVLSPIVRVRFATTANEALALIDNVLPDLILLDVELPDMNGIALCSQLKAAVTTEQIPVLFITSSTEMGFEERVFDVGAADYISKPLKPRVVAARVQTHLAYCQAINTLSQMAHIDGLTLLANRLTFDERLHIEFQRSKRHREPLSIIMIDIDEFKKFNDYFGHLDGDDCIRKIASALAGSIKRSTDLAARFGGEEFALILPDTDQAGAACVADAVINNVRLLNIPHAPSSQFDHVTVSLGFTSLEPELVNIADITAAQLVQTADNALYYSKRHGRNQSTYNPAGNHDLEIDYQAGVADNNESSDLPALESKAGTTL